MKLSDYAMACNMATDPAITEIRNAPEPGQNVTGGSTYEGPG